MKSKKLKIVKNFPNLDDLPNRDDPLYDSWKHPTHWYSKIPIPIALQWHKWDEWEKEMKSQYPIRYYAQKTIPNFFSKIAFKVNDFKWNFLHRVHPNHRYNIVRTGLKPGYYDPDTLMIHSCFNLLKIFVEYHIKETPVEWDADEDGKKAWKEMMFLNNWWVYERPAREEKFNKEHEWPDLGTEFEIFDTDKENDPDVIEYKKILDLYMKAKEEWHKEDEDMFIRLIKMRRYLWYP